MPVESLSGCRGCGGGNGASGGGRKCTVSGGGGAPEALPVVCDRVELSDESREELERRCVRLRFHRQEAIIEPEVSQKALSDVAEEKAREFLGRGRL